MKKQLLFGFAAFTALAVTAQNSSKVLTNPTVKKMVTFKPVATEEPTNKISQVSNTTNKVSAAPYKRIGGSSNVFGMLLSESRQLTYNKDINTLGMVHRKQAGWTGVTGGNSGTIIYAYSANGGTSWDTTVLAASSANLMRYPTGTIYNPTGNTNPANAFALGSGPWHPGANWQGNYFASKQLSFPGNNTTGSAIFQDNLNITANPNLAKQDFSRIAMQASTNGKVHVLAGIYADANGATAAAQGFRGAMINTGTYNAGTFTWAGDSLKPNFKIDGAGDAIAYSQYNHAWSEDGMTGYVIFNGVDANAVAGTSMNSYLPYVYKTTNGGTSWARHAPLFDFSSIPSVGGRTYAVGGTTTTFSKPWVSISEGSSATVDANGNLHFLATFGSGASDHIDSLGYTFNVDFINTWNYVTDFYTTSNGWCAVVIDSLKTDGPDAANSNWLSSTGNLSYDARLQISRTTDGQKLFYSWADSDPAITGSTFNTLPNIFMKGYDVNSLMATGTIDMTSTKPGPGYASYWFLASPIVANPLPGTWTIPSVYTVSDDASLSGDAAVSYYYIDDNTITAADFSIVEAGMCVPVGIKQLSSVFENLNFYPNPASNNATIDVALNETAKLDITILNTVGQSVYSTSVNGNVGSNKVDVNLSNLSAGLYFYQVKIGNSKAITRKFAVEK